jgi:hypothetical protein
MTTNPTPFIYPNCTCARVWRDANATPDTPWFAGIRRFAGWKITNYSEDCTTHGHMFSEYGLAAALRYDLPLGTR